MSEPKETPNHMFLSGSAGPEIQTLFFLGQFIIMLTTQDDDYSRPMSDRMILQGDAQNENTLKT